MTCNVMDGLFAWVGQASLGGYIGAVFAAFLSSVISGAAGTYKVTMTGNQTVLTDLTIEPGQVVVINGDRALPQPPTWGSGGFTVGESASLSLNYLQVDTMIQIDEGPAQLSLDSCVVTFSGTLLLRDGMEVTFTNQIFHDPTFVAVASGVTLVGKVCDPITGNCVQDLCAAGTPLGCSSSSGVGGICVSPVGSCACAKGYTGNNCEIRTCCTKVDNYGITCCCNTYPQRTCQPPASSCNGGSGVQYCDSRFAWDSGACNNNGCGNGCDRTLLGEVLLSDSDGCLGVVEVST